jgi:hypothetical protein
MGLGLLLITGLLGNWLPEDEKPTSQDLLPISEASFAGRKVSKRGQTPFLPVRMILIQKGDRFRTMSKTQPHSSGDYSFWLGQWAVLKVATGKLQTEMVCTVIAESDSEIRIRIADICEVDIYKEMILGVARAWPMLTPT